MNLAILILFGLEFGSFANVCIYRWPRNQSIFKPARSHCPWCDAQITWWQNIPVLSFIFLRARCASCRSSISWRYPFVEISMALLWGAGGLALQSAFQPIAMPFLICVCVFLFTLLVTTMTDLDWKIIPDEAVFLLLSVAIATAPWNRFIGLSGGWTNVGRSVVGALIGGAPVWLIAVMGKSLLGKDAIGDGDIKLLAAVGATLNGVAALSSLFVGAMLGGAVALIGLLLGKLKRNQYIPFGPFLNAAALIEFFLRCRHSSLLSLLSGIFTPK